tara:strand:- start:1515 stop:1727 length:213 start_codon:yes stop_codon:yes gene_type:complete
MLRVSKQEWGKFYTLYGAEMYRDKLPMTAKVCEEDPDYMNVSFGEGCNLNGYDLYEEFKQQSAKQGELNV